jgi:branched-chain amino acid transport system permease protein
MALYIQFVVDALLQGALYSLMAVGMSLCFGVTRIINFAYGEFVMLGAYGAFWLSTVWGVDPLIALPLLAVLGYVAGMLTFRTCITRVLDAPQINQILITFGIGLVLQNFAVIAWTGDVRSLQPHYALESFNFGIVILPFGQLIAVAIAIMAFAALAFWLERTELGRATQAIAQNGQAASLVGINVKFVYELSFSISTAMAVASGVVMSFLVPIFPFMGFGIIVKIFAIVILGGLSSITGSIAGAFALALSETAVAYFVPDGNAWAEGVAFAVLMSILILRPSGIVPQAAED